MNSECFLFARFTTILERLDREIDLEDKEAHRLDASPIFLNGLGCFMVVACVFFSASVFCRLVVTYQAVSSSLTQRIGVRRTASISEHSKGCLRPVVFATHRSPLCRRAPSCAPHFMVRFFFPDPWSGKMICLSGLKDFAENRMDGEASASSTKSVGFSQPHHPVGPE